MPKKVLVIDNDPDFVEAVVSVLEAEGYETLSATDAAAGISKAKQDMPDLILLDIMMQHVSQGLDVALTLRDDPATAKISVVFITGIHKPQFLTDSYRPGEEWPNVKGTMEKPLKPKELLTFVQSIIG